MVVAAADMVRREYGAALSRENLLEIWRNEEYPLGIKYLSTLWWGNKTRNASVAYSERNIDLLNRFQADLNEALIHISTANDLNEALILLSELFYEMELHRNLEGGDFYLEQIGSAFFTKVLQYFFASHPIESNPAFLPVICDQWLCRAVYIEMTENEQFAQRDAIFRNPTSFRCHNDSCSDSYRAFINYFNERVGQLALSHPSLTSFEMEGRIFSTEGRNYIKNYDDQRRYLFIPIEPGAITSRQADFGYEVRVGGNDYYLFIGHKKSFHYCELLAKRARQPISSFPGLQILRDNGFNKERTNYIYKKLGNPYDENQARDYLESIRSLFA